ncbi:hypothetical protein OPV22_009555 [Ensete ventricosum]|uniref:Uncharacterized protein n=1 Tax=Ensete ventricosum TaxID=4639 RepID=A0AAV8RJ66_ENSVE|nr:hypothetical protein OPV22_009555 [Ensete ventricosum]
MWTGAFVAERGPLLSTTRGGITGLSSSNPLASPSVRTPTRPPPPRSLRIGPFPGSQLVPRAFVGQVAVVPALEAPAIVLVDPPTAERAAAVDDLPVHGSAAATASWGETKRTKEMP